MIATEIREHLAKRIAQARKTTAVCNSDIWDQFQIEIRSLAQLTKQPTGLIVADLLDDADQIDDCEATPMGATPIVNPHPKGWDKIEPCPEMVNTMPKIHELIEQLRQFPQSAGVEFVRHYQEKGLQKWQLFDLLSIEANTQKPEDGEIITFWVKPKDDGTTL